MENNSFYVNLFRCQNFSILMINEITLVEKFLPPRIFLYNEFCKGLISIYFGLKYNSFWYYMLPPLRWVVIDMYIPLRERNFDTAFFQLFFTLLHDVEIHVPVLGGCGPRAYKQFHR